MICYAYRVLYRQIPPDGDEAGGNTKHDAGTEHDEGKLDDVGEEITEEVEFWHEECQLGRREPCDGEKNEHDDGGRGSPV